MKPLNLLRIETALTLALGLGLTLAACGNDGEPVPGNADPCHAPLGGVLGCPADRQLGDGTNNLAAGTTIEQACDKLVACGVLAAEYFGQRGSECSNGDDCPGGECRANSEGAKHCYFHRLDYAWCVAKLQAPGSNRCDNDDHFTEDEVAAALTCIARTPCASLGLPLTEKLASSDSELDRYVCNDGETRVSTATICDHGLLIYR